MSGFEVLSNVKDDEAVIYVCLHIIEHFDLLTKTSDIRQFGPRFRTVCSARARPWRLGCH